MADTDTQPNAGAGGTEITITPRPYRQEAPGAGQGGGDVSVPGGAPRSDDAAVDYAVQKAREEADALEQRARAKYGVAAPTVNPAERGVTVTPPAAPGAPAAAAPPSIDPMTGMPVQGEAAIPPEMMQEPATEALKRAGRFVVNEAVHAPAAAAAGVGDAGKELFNSADSLATWLNDKVPLTLPIPKTGSDTVDSALANPAHAVASMIDAITPTAGDSATAPMIKGVAQFLTGMALGGKLLEGAGVALTGTKAALAKGFSSDALAFDPKDENLSNLLQKVPALQGPVTGFLATKPDDNEALNRLRRAVEGLGLGAATEGIIAGLRFYRARNAAKAVEKPAADAAAVAREQEAKYGKLPAEDLAKATGDAGPDAPLVQMKAADAVKTTERPKAAQGNVLAYHGTGRKFEVFDNKYQSQGAHFFTDSPDVAKRHGGDKGRVLHAELALKNPLTVDWRGGLYSTERMNDLLRQAKDGGHDGLIVSNIRDFSDSAPATTYAVFKGENAQILKEPPAAADLVARADDPEAQAAVKAEPKPGEKDAPQPGDYPGRIAVNWSRINGPDDVKAAMRMLADQFAEKIDAARRGKMSQEETMRLAAERGMTVDELLARRNGQALNAEETMAARQLLQAASEHTVATARAAAMPNAGPLELFAYRRAVATEAALLQEVLAARAEAGRALAAWKIPASAAGDVERSKAILDALAAGGSEADTREIARRHAILIESGADQAAQDKMVMAAAGATRWQAVQEVWVNGLLSNPGTHIVNAASNTLALAQQIIERGVAEKLARATGSTGVAPGEAAAMISGIIAAQKDAWRLAWLALKSGETGLAVGKVDVGHPAAFTADTFGIQNNALAKTVDYLGHVERVPARLLGAADEYYKSVGYRMELHAQAVRQATSEGLSGVELRQRAAQIVANPPENIRLEAVDAALYSTFTNDAGAAADALIKLREAWPATVFIFPFVRTPVNIAKYGFARTPLAFAMSGVRADLAAGGARAQLALARISTGTSIMLLAADYADRGMITGVGPRDQAKREVLVRQGWQPYSVRVGNKWVAYDRADPYGMLLGFAADMAEINRRMDIEGDKLDEFSELWAAGITVVSQWTVNRTYMNGLADFMWMMEDPQRRAFGYLGQQVGSFVPAAMALAKRMDDPVYRENMKLSDYVQSRVVGFSRDLTPARDLWGAERQPNSGYGPEADAINPFHVAQPKESPIDAEMQRLDIGVDRIPHKTMIEGVAINFKDWPQVYDRYVQLAGNELQSPVWHQGAKDFLDAVVTGKSPESAIYKQMSDGSDGGKADFIKAAIQRYRKAAQEAILADPRFGAFQQAWRDARDHQNELKARLAGVKPPPTPDVPRTMPPGATDTPAAPMPAARPAPSISPMQVP